MDTSISASIVRSKAATLSAKVTDLFEKRQGPQLLDATALMRDAEVMTGLNCWTENTLFLKGYTELIGFINQEGGLDALGRKLAKADMQRILRNHLVFESMHKNSPSQPIAHEAAFIVGFGRTGSTLLHNLLALDPAHCAPSFHEMIHYGDAKAGDMNRAEGLAFAEKMLAQLKELSPDLFALHGIKAAKPDECHYLFDSSFVSPHLCMYYHVPGYWDWLKENRDRIGPDLYKHFSKEIGLLFALEGKRWLGKSLVHQFYFDSLLKQFPDAHVIRLHREPGQAIASLCSLIARYRNLYSDKYELAQLGSFVAELFQIGAKVMIDSQPASLGARYCDVTFTELRADPIGAVLKIYSHFSWNVPDTLVSKMTSYMKENLIPPTSYHQPKLADFGLSDSAVKAASSDYLDWLSDARITL